LAAVAFAVKKSHMAQIITGALLARVTLEKSSCCFVVWNAGKITYPLQGTKAPTI